MSLSARTHLPNLPRYADQRPIFERFAARRYALEPAGAADQAEEAELKREAGLDRLLGRRLAGLVIDDCEPAVGKPVDPVGPAVHGHAGDAASPRLRPAADAALAPGCSAPARQSSRSPRAVAAPTAREASGGLLSPASRRSARARSLSGLQWSCSQPFLNALWTACLSTRAVWSASTGSSLRSRGSTRVKGERVGLQAIHCVTEIRSGRCSGGGDGAAGRRAAAARDRRALCACRSSAKIARQAAADRLQPKQETRGYRRRAAVTPGAGEQHFGRAERACEIMRGKADAELQVGIPRFARTFGGSHGSGAGSAGHTPSFRPPRTTRSAR